MANYSVLKAAVQAVVKTNGNQEITGANMQSTLISIINSLGTGYQFMGVATPSTSPGTPDYNVAYIGGAGTYANFGTSVTVPVGSIGVFKYNGSWTKEQIALFAGIDDEPTAGSNNLVKSGGVLEYASATDEYTYSGATRYKYIDIPVSENVGTGYYCEIKGEPFANVTSIGAYMMGGSTRQIVVYKKSDKYVAGTVYTEDDKAANRNKFRVYFNNITDSADITVYFSKYPLGIQGVLNKSIPGNISVSSISKDAVFEIDTTSNKLIVNGNVILSCGDGLLVNVNSNYETTISANKQYLGIIIYNRTDSKLYYVSYDEIENYPEYNIDNNRLNYHIGSIQYTGYGWMIGFPFSHIIIDGEDIYGNLSKVSTSMVDFIHRERTANMFNKDTAVHGYYGIDGVTYRDSNIFWCSDYIEVAAGKKYKRTHDKSYFVYAYDSSKQPVVVSGNNVYWQLDFEDSTIPVGVAYIRVIFRPAKINTYMVTEVDFVIVNYLPYYIETLDPSIHIINSNEQDITNFSMSDVGNVEYQEIDDTDYSQIIMYGQSLSMGWEAPEAIAEPPIPNVYMIGDKVSINHGNNGQNVLTPLVSTLASNCGENPTVTTANSFVNLYRRFVNKQQKFIATSCGEGGKSIEQLSKECTNGTNYYTTEFLSTLSRTKTAVQAENKSVGCFAILFMQGEFNYTNLEGGGLTPGIDATDDKDTYKAYLLTLKNNMQADIMSTYGQTKKPLFFIYETAGSYIRNFEMSINMAQVEFALENDDVFLLPPTYPVPDYNGGHLSTNGYRWYGEMIAKSLYNVYIKGLRFYPIFPQKYTISGNALKIDMMVPVLPMLFDTWTKETILNMGFRVQVNDADVTISNIEIKDNAVVLVCASELTGKVAVAYAGYGRNGSGNLRDSDTWHSLYDYYDDRETSPSKRENYTPKDENGSYIYEEPYPMYNWCGNFYKLVSNE